jgi:broad specificity phosphatase PhoE
MKTVLYLIRHGATAANLASPPILQGRRMDLPLVGLGVRQAEVTRDFLAVRPIDGCYSSPLTRALQTAAIIALPHGLRPTPLETLTECDVGRWEGLDWHTIHANEPEEYRRFIRNPARFGYPDGESFADVAERAGAAIENILTDHHGGRILVVGHHVVNRTYLAGVLGLRAAQARLVSLDNCGISVVVREGKQTSVSTLNASFHLEGLAAA